MNTMDNFEAITNKKVAVAYKRWYFTRVPNVVISLGGFQCFSEMAFCGRWSLMRGGRTWTGVVTVVTDI